jgi:hypothetical protein
MTKSKLNSFLEKAIQALRESKSVSQAANRLGLNERTLRKKFQKYSMHPPSHYIDDRNFDFLLSEEQKKAILSLYSSYHGSPKSVFKISTKLNIPKETVRKFLKENDLTHESLPVTTSEKKELTSDKLFQIVDELRDIRLVQSVQEKEYSLLKEESKKWRNFKKSVLDSILTTIVEHCKNYEPPKVQKFYKKCNDYSLIFPLQDFHWGKLSKKIDVGEKNEHNYDILKNAVKNAFDFLEDKVVKNGNPEIIYFTVGGDFLHIDSSKNTTTRGTPQDSESSFSHMIVSGVFEAINMVERLLLLSEKVKLIPTPGNHDKDTSVSLYCMVAFWFRNNPRVETLFGNISNACTFEDLKIQIKSRHYERYGNSLLCFSHGDGAAPKNMPLLIPQEARDLWADTKYTYFFVGHKHHKHVQDYYGVMQIQVPSIAGADRWHELNGFTSSNKGLTFYCVDKENGMFCEWFYNR